LRLELREVENRALESSTEAQTTEQRELNNLRFELKEQFQAELQAQLDQQRVELGEAKDAEPIVVAERMPGVVGKTIADARTAELTTTMPQEAFGEATPPHDGDHAGGDTVVAALTARLNAAMAREVTLEAEVERAQADASNVEILRERLVSMESDAVRFRLQSEAELEVARAELWAQPVHDSLATAICARGHHELAEGTEPPSCPDASLLLGTSQGAEAALRSEEIKEREDALTKIAGLEEQLAIAQASIEECSRQRAEEEQTCKSPGSACSFHSFDATSRTVPFISAPTLATDAAANATTADAAHEELLAELARERDGHTAAASAAEVAWSLHSELRGEASAAEAALEDSEMRAHELHQELATLAISHAPKVKEHEALAKELQVELSRNRLEETAVQENMEVAIFTEANAVDAIRRELQAELSQHRLEGTLTEANVVEAMRQETHMTKVALEGSEVRLGQHELQSSELSGELDRARAESKAAQDALQAVRDSEAGFEMSTTMLRV
jgi:hypothetical protein